MSFFERLLGGRIAAGERATVLNYWVEEQTLKALQDAEAGRYNDVLTKYGGSIAPGSAFPDEVVSASRRMAQVNADLRRRHGARIAVPDEAGPCYFVPGRRPIWLWRNGRLLRHLRTREWLLASCPP